jgi:serine-type D-Ala-D-Ala carboxypeptidase (penicillin-binding protein 5/6)
MRMSTALLTGALAMAMAASPSVALAAGSGAQALAASRTAGGPAVRLSGADLVSAGTGEQLWSKSLNVARPMGSITKVMTALVVLEAGHLDRKITVTPGAIRYVSKDGASSAGLVQGDVLTARQLLEAMLLPSGCDAAYLLATAYGPGRSAFIKLMNSTAEAIGLTATHFSSFDGMPFPTEHSTFASPADLIKLGEQAMRHPIFRQIVRQRSYYLPMTSAHHSYLWKTTNQLIGSYPGVLGIKTGDTDAAGNCLLFEAKRNGHTLIGVVLHAYRSSNPSSAIGAARHILTWGFRHLSGDSAYARARDRQP